MSATNNLISSILSLSLTLLLGLLAVTTPLLLIRPASAAAAVSPHAIGYRGGVTGRVGDLGPRMPGGSGSQMNPCNRTSGLYDVCDGPYSFVRCRGRDPLLIADCIQKPRYQCWYDAEEGEASCGRPEQAECVTSAGEWNSDADE